MTRILLIRLSAIGDIVLTTPLIRALRKTYPSAIIDYLTNEEFYPILLGNNAISSVYSPPHFQPKEKYDLIIDLQYNGKSKAYHRFGNQILHYHKENWKKVLLILFKLNIYKQYQSVAERYAKVINHLGIKLDDAGTDIVLSENEFHFGKREKRMGIPVLAVCHGAQHYTKRYPPVQFARVINQVCSDTSLDIWLIGGEKEKELSNSIFNNLKSQDRVKNFTGKHSLRESISLIANADVVLSNDTGLMHVASAFKKPIVALFGSSVKEFGFQPYKTLNQVIEVEGLYCRPCSHIGRERCPENHFKCMMDIPIEQITNAVKSFLSKEHQ